MPTINLENIKSTAKVGIRRCIVFMGLGLNAGHDDRLNEYVLDKHTYMNLVPRELPPEKVADFKNEFCKWIVTCGMRELVEACAVYMDQLYMALLMVNASIEPNQRSTHGKLLKSFEHSGISNKIAMLREEFAIAPPYFEFLASISDARNCLAHRNGIVGLRDCKHQGQLSVKWRGFEMAAVDKSGIERKITLPVRPGEVYLDNERLKVTIVTKSKSFEVGSRLTFSAVELSEICWFADWLTDEVANSAVAYCRSVGIEVQEIDSSNALGRESGSESQ